ncbi:uncharacterized protein LOC118437475 [Folsomia candida]|nr:uncharacterized protein LOC118437475 [Folsomia candida]
MLDYPRQPDAGLNTTWLKRYNVPGNSRESTDTYELHKPQQELRIEELFLLQRNFVPMILLVLSLGHICTGDVSLFFRRTFIAKYFTFWEEAVEIMKMDAGKHPDNVHKYLIRVTSFYAGFLVVFIGLCAGRIAPVATGAPTQLVILWSRLFFPSIHAWKYLHILRWFGIVVYVYLLMCSKVYILLLLYICKILKNAYATWNERLVTVIHKGKKEEKKSRKEHCAARTGFDHLFRDYVVLLDLLRGADTMFANVIESYFGTQVFSLCFEVYYLLRTFSAHDEFAFARKLDGILITIYLFHSVIMLLLATNASAQVGEEAMEGLEIIRRNGCIGHKSIKEMYFTLSLYMSYTGHFETALTAGKFVTFDRSFMVSLVGTIFSYFIILTQFTPPLSMLDPNKLELINTKHLIINVESTYQINADMKVGYDTLSNITT